ncbi:hypothetical protein EJ08DRAFT_646620 [Tothia fuscella]|uniref:Uncharacterized protein n=1 Tax=Tothia fuscella TaxID=1048955 RepID=A0A9P4NXF0_9PEZI|nr:hypothetical protein EJ08DRAFT_646620 [Tothia fuscella]
MPLRLPKTTTIFHTSSPRITRTTPQFQLQQSFHTTPIRPIKEDADRSPQEIENKKNEQIEKQKKGEGEWHESLASAGESNIAADKEHVKDHEDHIEDLQKETAKDAENGKI